jgi:hypothetical protein
MEIKFNKTVKGILHLCEKVRCSIVKQGNVLYLNGR